MNDELMIYYDLYDATVKKIRAMNEKIRQHGGEIPNSDVDCIDKLAHMAKSLKTVIAMLESENGGYSNRSYRLNYSNGDGQSYRGYSYGRDRMGRYSRDDGLTEMINNLSDDKRMQVQRYIEDMNR